MSAAATARGPGRPSSGARERVLEAGLEVLKEDGYAGLTTAKVAARAGQNKALISYHFGSKQGLVAAVGRELSDQVTEEMLGGLEDRAHGGAARARRGGGAGRADGPRRAARPALLRPRRVSVVEPDVRAVMSEMKESWRALLASLLAGAEDGPRRAKAHVGAVFLLAGLDGLALERLGRGATKEYAAAERMFVTAAVTALRG